MIFGSLNKIRELEKVYKLTEELIKIFQVGNVIIEESWFDDYSIASHSDYIRATEILAQLEKIFNN